MRIGIAATVAEREACFGIRRAVFIEEQAIPEAEEWDEHDATATHFLAVADGAPAGTARLIAKGDLAKIGRVAVVKAQRGTGMGLALMEHIVTHAREIGFAAAVLDAQVYAIPFYGRLGFAAEGPEFDDGSGIMHRRMRRALTRDDAPISDKAANRDGRRGPPA